MARAPGRRAGARWRAIRSYRSSGSVSPPRCAGALLLLAALYAVPARGAEFSTGGSFLPLGHGARAYALGGVGVAVLRDDEAVYWNPANLAWLGSRNGVTLMHADILPGVEDGYDTVSFARTYGERLGESSQVIRPTRWGYGFFVSHLGFDFTSGAGWSESVVQGGVAIAINNFASAGLGVKGLFLSNDFDTAGATGAGFDLGVSVLLVDRITAAVVGRDVFTRVSWDTSKHETLAPSLTLGFEYRPHRRWTTEVDFMLREGAAQRAAAGLEWQVFRNLVWLRGGLTMVTPGERRTYASTGAGLAFSHFVLDYGVSFDAEDALEDGHRVSLRALF
jgi:hypothetical protein